MTRVLDRGLLPLRNGQAVLREMQPGDARAYAVGTTDRIVRRYAHLPEPEYTEDSVKALIAGPIREGLERGDLAVLTIAQPGSDIFAGSLVLFGAEERSVEVGFWVHHDHRGEGRAGGALLLAARLAALSGFTSLVARTVPGNSASQRVLEGSGFVYERTTQDVAPSGRSVELKRFVLRLTTPPDASLSPL